MNQEPQQRVSAPNHSQFHSSVHKTCTAKLVKRGNERFLNSDAVKLYIHGSALDEARQNSSCLLRSSDLKLVQDLVFLIDITHQLVIISFARQVVVTWVCHKNCRLIKNILSIEKCPSPKRPL